MDRPVYQSRKRRPSRYGSTYPASGKTSALVTKIIYLSLLLCIWLWVVPSLVTKGDLAFGGVPMSIVISFLQDETARDAYFQGDKQKLHARLEDMGIEERIKAFYRPQISDEVNLDQYIHQIFYDRTGYVGKAYRVNSQGVLVLKVRGAAGNIP